MTAKPYELLARFKPDGVTIAGVSVRTIEVVGGKTYESDPVPLSGASDPSFTAFAASFAAAAVAERDSLAVAKSALESEKATLTAERDSLVAAKTQLESDVAEVTDDLQIATSQLESVTGERNSLQSQLTTAQARIAELELQLNPPGPDLTTVDGVRQHLRDVRYEHETEGFSIEGQSITTNRDESATWLGMLLSLSTNPQSAYPYTPRNGETVLLTPSQVQRAGQVYQWYVLNCFAKEYEFTQRLKAGEPLRSLVDSIDNTASWPQREFLWNPS